MKQFLVLFTILPFVVEANIASEPFNQLNYTDSIYEIQSSIDSSNESAHNKPPQTKSGNRTFESGQEQQEQGADNRPFWLAYVFGSIFCIFTVLSLLSLVNMLATKASGKNFNLLSAVCMCVFCAIRCYSIWKESESTTTVYGVIICHDVPEILLPTSYALVYSGACLFCQVSWWKFQPLKPLIFILFMVPMILMLVSSNILTIILWYLGHAGSCWWITLVKKINSAIWSLLMISLSWSIQSAVYKASLTKQSQMVRATLTKMHIKGTHLPKTLPRPKLCISIRTLLVASVFCFSLTLNQIYGILLTQDQSLNFFQKRAPKWLWETHFAVSRALEVCICCCLVCVHYWVFSGHCCHSFLNRLSTLCAVQSRQILWNSYSGSLLDRCRSSRQMDIYSPTISHSQSKFGKYKCVGSAVVSENETIGFVDKHATVRPVLKTFQRISQLSPGHLQKSSGAQFTGRNVVANLKLLTSRRSSSSSGSSVLHGKHSRKGPTPKSSRDAAMNCLSKYKDCSLPRKPIPQSLPQFQKPNSRSSPLFRERSVTRKRLRHVSQHKRTSAIDNSKARRKMVSKATQVYIPSPYRNICTEDDTYSNFDDKITESAAKSSNQMLQSASLVPCNGINLMKCLKKTIGVGKSLEWQVANSSTSCSSESAGNSFDVHYYGDVCASSDDVSPNCSSSLSIEFHDHLYRGFVSIHNKSLKDGNRNINPDIDLCPDITAKDLRFDTTVIKENIVEVDADGGHCEQSIAKLERGLSRLDQSTNDDLVGVKDLEKQNQSSTNNTNLSLTLPLADLFEKFSQPKNLQDITPDSAVYLELNLPLKSKEGNLPPHISNMIKFKSLSNLYKQAVLTANTNQKEDRLKRLKSSKSLSNLESLPVIDDEYSCDNASFCDSVYDSNFSIGEPSSISSDECYNKYKN